MDNQVVQNTTNYGQFKLLGNNRVQSESHVKRLVQAIQEGGNLTKVQPVLVNEHMEVIDGQHRLAACEQLGEPVYFTVYPGLRIEDARKMNVLHRGWKLDDYAHSYATTIQSYRDYLKLKESYGFAHSIMLHYIRNSHNDKGHYAEFKNGELVIEDLEGAKTRLNHLGAVSELVPELAYESPFAFALLKAMRVEGYEEERMLNKLRQSGNRLHRYSSVGDNLRQLEELYNHNVNEANRLRFF